MKLPGFFDRMGKRKLISFAIAAVVVVFFALEPLWVNVDDNYLGGIVIFYLCLYLTVAQGWNLVAGYTGQISLGGNAFFGVGAYTFGLMYIHKIRLAEGLFDPTLLLLGGVAPMVLAFIIGAPLLARLRGDYFAFGTLGVGSIVTTLFIKGGTFTGGAQGVQMLELPQYAQDNMRSFYYLALLVAVLTTLCVYFLTNSRVGLALKAIREDEVAAASHGVPVLRYKLIAFAVGAFWAGIAGVIFAYYRMLIDPASVLTLNWMFYPIMMCVLGGVGTIVGPIIGTLGLGILFQYGDIWFKGYHPIVSGVLIILVMVFMPGGIMGLVEKAPSLWQRGGSARGAA